MDRLLVALLCAFAVTAEARTLTYEYSGERFMCGNPEQPLPIDYNCAWGTVFDVDDSGSVAGWHSLLTVHERLFPGKTVAGATVRYLTYLGQIDPDDAYDTHHWWIDVESPYAIFHESGKSPHELPPEQTIPFLAVGGDFRKFFEPYEILEHGFTVQFDEDKNIVYSSGHYALGGTPDFSHSLVFGDILFGAVHDDFRGSCRTFETESGALWGDGICSKPGRWERISTGPSPIPLPGAIWLYAGAVGASLSIRRMIGRATRGA